MCGSIISLMYVCVVVHPITLEARLQATMKPGRKMDIPQALVKVTLQQVALSLSQHQVCPRLANFTIDHCSKVYGCRTWQATGH